MFVHVMITFTMHHLLVGHALPCMIYAGSSQLCQSEREREAMSTQYNNITCSTVVMINVV